MSRIVILHWLRTLWGFVSFKERGVGYLPHWNVGHARQAWRRINGVQGSEHSASSNEPCRQLRSPFPSPHPREWLVTGERWATQYGTSWGVPHSVSLRGDHRLNLAFRNFLSATLIHVPPPPFLWISNRTNSSYFLKLRLIETIFAQATPSRPNIAAGTSQSTNFCHTQGQSTLKFPLVGMVYSKVVF